MTTTSSDLISDSSSIISSFSDISVCREDPIFSFIWCNSLIITSLSLCFDDKISHACAGSQLFWFLLVNRPEGAREINENIWKINWVYI